MEASVFMRSASHELHRRLLLTRGDIRDVINRHKHGLT